jgi:hypothetical protein
MSQKPLIPDLGVAHGFLATLSLRQPITLQTFTDDKDKLTNGHDPLAKILHGPVAQHEAELLRLQSQGAGVFFMVNVGDGAGRANENVRQVRAVFADLDGAPLAPVLAAGLKPHAVAESSPGRYHVYWLTVCPLDQFKPVQKAIAARFGSDPNVNDLCRVMRVPGFWHQKGTPFQSRVLKLEAMEPYALAHVIATLGLDLAPATAAPAPQQEQPARTRSKKKKHRRRPLDQVREMLAHVDAGNRDFWLGTGIILGREYDRSDDAWAVYQEWAATSDKFNEDSAGNLARTKEAFYERSQDEPRAGAAELTMGSLIKWARDGGWKEAGLALEDFYAYSPMHQYIYRHTRALWPGSTVNARLWLKMEQGMLPSDWLDLRRSVEAMTWHPDCPEIVEGRLPFEGGWCEQAGAKTFNLYRSPAVIEGDAHAAGRWRDHLHHIYPTDAQHIECWLAFKLQNPGKKINHALVLGGKQGIGKDTALEAVKHGVGPWNWKEIAPPVMFGRFNPWVKAVVVRVSETRDLGEVDRYKFYDHSKSYLAAPPDVLQCDEKNLREHPVFNVAGFIFTTNHKTNGLFLPPDDRRHYVTWSELEKEEFAVEYWQKFWAWLEKEGGIGAVVAYLRGLDLSTFDAKAPPPKTDAWWAIVQANEDGEGADLRNVMSKLNQPPVVAFATVLDTAKLDTELYNMLADRRNRRRIPHLMEAAGYVPVRNTSNKHGRWVVGGKEVTIYGRNDVDQRERLAAARALVANGLPF